jgi:hypothetical protein
MEPKKLNITALKSIIETHLTHDDKISLIDTIIDNMYHVTITASMFGYAEGKKIGNGSLLPTLLKKLK